MKQRRSVLVLIAVTTSLLLWEYIGPVGPGDALSAIVFGDDTVYADGYSPFRFIRVQRGDDKAAVVRLLGRPLTVTKDPVLLETWEYSRGRTDASNYYVRRIHFDREGRVYRTSRRFEVD